jgi:(S)-citramalyl-CoA lyase
MLLLDIGLVDADGVKYSTSTEAITMHDYLTNDETRPLRSWLFTPATRPERFEKAAGVGADVMIIDLEDAVAPADKDQARSTAIDYLWKSRTAPIAATALRMNSLNTRAGLADIAGLVHSKAAPDFLVLPKTESSAHLAILDRLLAAAGKTIRLVAIVESAAGLAAVGEIVSATPRLAAIMFGAADMAADLGAETAWESLLYSRSRLVAACAHRGVLALDSPYFDIRDHDGLAQEIARSHALGFAAKAAIHPTQIAPINAALTPSPAAVTEARAILAENAKGVGVVNGRMIDAAVARNARHTLAAAGISI